MALHSTAQGLATLGRHGDSVLVHMQPQEVAGLQALAKSQGTSLTVNPHTGMPEAFRLGDFFTSLLPTLAGVALAPFSGGSSLIPILGGVATGAAVAGAKGEDVLGGALMGGLGGYGGGGLGKSFMGMGGAGAATPAISSGQGVQLTANNLTTPNLSGLSGTQAASALDASANNLSSTLTNPLGTGTGGAGIDLRNMMNQGSSTNLLSGLDKIPGQAGLPISSNALDLARPPSGFDSMMSGAGKFASDPIGQFDAFKEAGGSAMQLAPIGIAGLSAMQPEPYDFAADEAKRKAEENKYRDPITGKLNLSASSGLNLTGFAMGGQVDLNPSVGGGLSDLYNRPEGSTAQSISSDGYGMGRLDRLSQQGSLAKAGDMFYAQGGYLDGQGDGMSDSIPATIEGKQPARLADGEFVVPADVVSHIGNGSSKAGSKRLYAMLDKVRHARTGNKKQGKQINPSKYMPA